MKSLLATLPKMSWLLVFLPVAIGLKIGGVEGLPLFIVSGIAILGTVTLIGKATEEAAIYTGPLWGGLLNATFGNVTELIIAVIALTKGPAMYDIVLGSIVGSILGNLLLVLGGAMLYGGTKYSVQKFSRTGANVNIGMLWVTLVTLVVPSLVHVAYRINPDAFENLTSEQAISLEENVSIAAAVILLALYGLMLLFSLRTHRFLLMPDPHHHEKADWSKRTAIGVLLGATLCVAFLSEAFVGSIEYMKHHNQIEMSDMFIGVVLVAVVGNAAEGMVAVWVAREDKMELSFQIAMGSCLQVALMVAPVLVLASWAMGDIMALAFDPFMLMSLAAATVIASAALTDGESNWLEGVLLLAVYIVLGIEFYFLPEGAAGHAPGGVVEVRAAPDVEGEELEGGAVGDAPEVEAPGTWAIRPARTAGLAAAGATRAVGPGGPIGAAIAAAVAAAVPPATSVADLGVVAHVVHRLGREHRHQGARKQQGQELLLHRRRSPSSVGGASWPALSSLVSGKRAGTSRGWRSGSSRARRARRPP